MHNRQLVFLFPLLLLAYSVYSYTQVDPNLVLSSNATYWNVQQQMWQIGYHNRPLSTAIFCTLIIALYGIYAVIQRSALSKKQIIILFIASIIALLPSYPALSHDIYNYLFNAKMVTMYQANPHIQVAMDFPNDPWLKIMHNIHTPAPYGYGWTLLSLLPYIIGGGHLQTEMLVFRGFMVLFFIAALTLYKRIDKSIELKDLTMLMFNPLILIELVSNIHNDVSMMFFALAAIALWKSKKNLPAFLLLAFSISIKYVTVVFLVLPIVTRLVKKIRWPELSAGLLLTPLVTTRSQRFLPWYLSWALFMLPLIKNRFLKTMLQTASFVGLLSYGFILYYGDYTPILLLYRSLFLFGVPMLVMPIIYTRTISSPSKQQA